MNVLTFDIEEWFHILDNESTRTEKEWAGFENRIHANVDRILGLLDDLDQKATFFCLGWVGRTFPEVIRSIVSNGHELASHSDQHQLVYEQTPGDFHADLIESISCLEDVAGHKIVAYRAPGFSITRQCQWAFEQLIEAGIEIDCSIFPAGRAHGGFPEYGEACPSTLVCNAAEMKELPMNTFSLLGKATVFSGGGYFRLLPYRAIKAMTKSSDYVMTYFHPRDFDAAQPVLADLTTVRRFKSYYGLSRAEDKLRTYLQDFDWVTVGEAVSQVDWRAAPRVDIE